MQRISTVPKKPCRAGISWRDPLKARNSHVQRGTVRPGAARRGVLSSRQPIDNDLYDAAVSLPRLKDLKSASPPFAEHLSLLVRDGRRRLLRL